MLSSKERLTLNNYQRFINQFGVTEMTDAEFENYIELLKKLRIKE